MELEYELLTSTRYDPFLRTCSWNDDADGSSPFMLLPYHLDRLLEAARLHGWEAVATKVTYESLKDECQKVVDEITTTESPTSCKIRITIDRGGRILVTASTVPALSADPTRLAYLPPEEILQLQGVEILQVTLDSRPTETSIFTKTKTTQRKAYDEARARNKLSFEPTGAPFDAILYNNNHQLTETTICNFAVYRSPFWVTPASTSGCLPGVLRRWLLEQGLIREATFSDLTLEDLQDGELVLLFNGVQGCRLGRLDLR